jgi:hypothetical protein
LFVRPSNVRQVGGLVLGVFLALSFFSDALDSARKKEK